MHNNHYIGIMSGTSMDGIDSTLVSFENETVKLIGTHSTPISPELKSTLLTLCQAKQIDIQLLGETDTQLGLLFAENCLTLLKKTGVPATDVIAIGSHGQTIYHYPTGNYPFTLQIGDPNIIAAKTDITTVADFRRRDIALGGQGAPLVPAFHNYLFGRKNTDQCVVNIGGMANITYLPNDQNQLIMGFDTGPGNTLLDQWHEKHRGNSMDFNGDWARSGKLHIELLACFLDDPYFAKKPPKSTGREYFNSHWLDQKLKSFGKTVHPNDVQATLTELTVQTIADAITHTPIIWICGGGAYNTFLMERLRVHCKNSEVISTNAIGIAPQWIEATAFAWLAKQTMQKKTGNCPSVTGARSKSVLGAIYPASPD